MDLHSKKVVGYSFSQIMNTDLVMKALDNAYLAQNPANGLILHTDLGSQYTSEEFRNYVQSKGTLMEFSISCGVLYPKLP
jgi:putative transposase